MKGYNSLFLLIFLFIFSCAGTSSYIQHSSKLNSTIPSKCTSGIKAAVSKPCIKYIYVIGKGAPPSDENLSEVQRYLLAERAAIVDGYRKLAEKLEGVIVSTLTKEGNYAINMDKVKVSAEAMIKGAEIVEIDHKDNGICIAKIKIRVPTEREIISYNY